MKKAGSVQSMAPSSRDRDRSRSIISVVILVVAFLLSQQVYMIIRSGNQKQLPCSSDPEFERVQNERNQFQDELQKLREESSNIIDDFKELKKLVDNLKTKIVNQNDIITSHETRFRKHESQISDLESAKSELESEVASKKLEIKKLADQLETAEKLKKDSSCERSKSGTYTRLRDRPEVQEIMERNIARGGEAPDKWRHRLLPAEGPNLWQQRVFKPHGIYGYIQLSGYRSDSDMFSAPGLVSKFYPKDKRMFEGCRWMGNDGKQIYGNLQLHLGSEGFDQQYEAGVLTCSIENPTTGAGGHVIARLDEEEFVMYNEEQLKDDSAVAPREPFPHFLTYCSPLLHDEMAARHVVEWLNFHRVVHNVSFFQLYDAGGVDASLRAQLQPYVDLGLLEITDMREVLLFSVVSWGQKLVIADCMHRNRYLSKWVFMGDLDEYLQTQPPSTVHSLLQKYHFKDFLAYGAFNWDVSRCANVTGPEQYVVERMLFRKARMHCVDLKRYTHELCYSGFGHRKYFLNPRKVVLANVHDPLPYDLDGHFFVGEEEMWHNHYRGLSSKYYEPNICTKSIKAEGSEDYELVKDVARLVSLVRACPVDQHPGCLEKVKRRLRVRWKKKGIAVKEDE